MHFLRFFEKHRVLSVFLTILVIGIIILLSFVFSSASDRNTVPSEFIKARSNAADLSASIVSLLASTTEQIQEAKRLVENGNNARALSVVSGETDRNKNIREQSVQLALELEKMAKAIPDIRSDAAAQTALVATSKETALIGKLLSYTNELNDLLTALQSVIGSLHPDYSTVNETIASMNNAATEINALNDAYKQEMSAFDRIIAGESPASSSAPTSTPSAPVSVR